MEVKLLIEQNIHDVAIQKCEACISNLQSNLGKQIEISNETQFSKYKYSEQELKRKIQIAEKSINKIVGQIVMLFFNFSIACEKTQQIQRHLECLNLADFFGQKFLKDFQGYQDLIEMVEQEYNNSYAYYKSQIKEEREIWDILKMKFKLKKRFENDKKFQNRSSSNGSFISHGQSHFCSTQERIYNKFCYDYINKNHYLVSDKFVTDEQRKQIQLDEAKDRKKNICRIFSRHKTSIARSPRFQNQLRHPKKEVRSKQTSFLQGFIQQQTKADKYDMSQSALDLRKRGQGSEHIKSNEKSNINIIKELQNSSNNLDNGNSNKGFGYYLTKGVHSPICGQSPKNNQQIRPIQNSDLLNSVVVKKIPEDNNTTNSGDLNFNNSTGIDQSTVLLNKSATINSNFNTIRKKQRQQQQGIFGLKRNQTYKEEVKNSYFQSNSSQTSGYNLLGSDYFTKQNSDNNSKQKRVNSSHMQHRHILQSSDSREPKIVSEKYFQKFKSELFRRDQQFTAEQLYNLTQSGRIFNNYRNISEYEEHQFNDKFIQNQQQHHIEKGLDYMRETTEYQIARSLEKSKWDDFVPIGKISQNSVDILSQAQKDQQQFNSCKGIMQRKNLIANIGQKQTNENQESKKYQNLNKQDKKSKYELYNKVQLDSEYKIKYYQVVAHIEEAQEKKKQFLKDQQLKQRIKETYKNEIKNNKSNKFKKLLLSHSKDLKLEKFKNAAKDQNDMKLKLLKQKVFGVKQNMDDKTLKQIIRGKQFSSKTNMMATMLLNASNSLKNNSPSPQKVRKNINQAKSNLSSIQKKNQQFQYKDAVDINEIRAKNSESIKASLEDVQKQIDQFEELQSRRLSKKNYPQEDDNFNQKQPYFSFHQNGIKEENNKQNINELQEGAQTDRQVTYQNQSSICSAYSQELYLDKKKYVKKQYTPTEYLMKDNYQLSQSCADYGKQLRQVQKFNNNAIDDNPNLLSSLLNPARFSTKYSSSNKVVTSSSNNQESSHEIKRNSSQNKKFFKTQFMNKIRKKEESFFQNL